MSIINSPYTPKTAENQANGRYFSPCPLLFCKNDHRYHNNWVILHLKDSFFIVHDKKLQIR